MTTRQRTFIETADAANLEARDLPPSYYASKALADKGCMLCRRGMQHANLRVYGVEGFRACICASCIAQHGGESRALDVARRAQTRAK